MKFLLNWKHSPRMIEWVPKTFMPIWTPDLHRVFWKHRTESLFRLVFRCFGIAFNLQGRPFSRGRIKSPGERIQK